MSSDPINNDTIPPLVPQTPVGTLPSASSPFGSPAPKKTSPLIKYFLFLLAILIPISIIGYVLYWNFLPFGFKKTYTLTAGSLEDTSGEIFFEPSKNISDRKSASLGGSTYSYREIYGPTPIVFKPNAVLRNAKAVTSIQGDSVTIIPSRIDINTIQSDWDYSWDFTREIPSDFSGDAFSFDGCAYFDGTNKIEMADSENEFENGPFSLYISWKPENKDDSSQQIIGHYNWEVFQNKDSIIFQLGRMNNKDGPFYIIKHAVKNDFFNKNHTALIVYSPSDGEGKSGYIDIYVDGNFSSRTNIKQDVIWPDYGNKPLSLGWSEHNYGKNPHFKGCVYGVKIKDGVVIENSQTLETSLTGTSMKFYLSNTDAAGIIRNVTLKINE